MTMIKIGEMAKICNISVQTLRYYDKLGVLCADYIDQSNGYRYYKPEKIQILQKLLLLKKLNFSLDEIKHFFNSTEEEQRILYSQKKRHIQESILTEKEKVKQLDNACAEPERGILSIEQQIMSVPFEDDPDVIGKWTYCGELASGEKFTDDTPLIKNEINLSTLFFLPGGGHVWTYFWTRGILYLALNKPDVLVPNPYSIVSPKTGTYLLLNWMVDKFVDSNASDCIRVYRQLDRKIYTEKQTFLYRDNVDVPFVPDERVLGSWESFDLLYSLDDFSLSAHVSDPTAFFIRGIDFYDRGRCFKHFRTSAGVRPHPYLYTAGSVLNGEMECAEHYEIRTVDKTDYLILEHKSGDYAYLGKVFCYYVFKRRGSSPASLQSHGKTSQI